MSEAWRVASIEYVEQIPVGVGSAMLRIAAVSRVDARPGDDRPALLVDDGSGVSVFPALPAPPDEGGVLRCAFSVPEEVTGLHPAFSLQLGDGDVIALPAPTATAPLGPPGTLAESGSPAFVDEPLDDPVPAAVVGEPGPAAGDPTLDLVLDAAEARAELAAMRELSALGPATAPAVPARRAAAPGPEDSGELAELRLWSTELERRLRDTTTALADAQAELRELHAGGAGPGTLDAITHSEIVAAALDEAERRAELDLADAG